MSEIVTVRDIDTITTEIKTIEMQVAKMAIYGCIEIGRRLVEAKEIVGHGGWGKYLAENVRYSQQWATNLMNLYREYGHQQESLFENFANSKSFGNLDVTKHILLLAVPVEERSEFVEANDVEHKSVAELKAVIRERDEAFAARDAAISARDDNLRELAAMDEENKRITAGMAEAADKLDAKDAELEQLQGKLKAADEKQAAEAKKVEALIKKLKAATDAEAKVRAELAQARANPEVPDAVMEELRKGMEADIAASATAEIRKELAAAQEQAAKADKARAVAEEQVAEAQRRIQMANPDMVQFSTYLTEAQDQFKKMVNALKKIAATAPATAEKLKGNIKEKLLDNLHKMIDMV